MSGAKLRVTLNRMESVMHRPHHSNVLDASALLRVRGFLARCGVTPSLYEARDDAPDEGRPKVDTGSHTN
jgi:hypothetical protein